MKNKKAFTLVELIAVVIIIAIISLLVIPSIVGLIKDKEDEMSETFQKIISSSADLYMSENQNKYVNVNGNNYCILLQDILDKGFLTPPIIDPVTKNEYNPNSFIQVKIENGKYNYDIVSECEEILS